MSSSNWHFFQGPGRLSEKKFVVKEKVSLRISRDLKSLVGWFGDPKDPLRKTTKAHLNPSFWQGPVILRGLKKHDS